MGLTLVRLLRAPFLCCLLAVTVHAAPKLRLTTSAVGPVPVAVGVAGPVQLVEAYNAGDGSLNLSVSTPASWLQASIGASAPCTARPGMCFPIGIGLLTGSLAKGMYTGIVTVKDPSAVDAPQTITVTVQVGGGVPDRVDLYVPPNGRSAFSNFYSNSGVRGAVSTQSGGAWLSFSVDALGSFGFAVSYRIAGQHLPGMAEGNYEGKVKITEAQFAPDNKDVPVTLHVTSQPIADATPARLKYRVVESGKKADQYVRFANRGLGALEIASITPVVPAGQNWLSVDGAAAPLYKVTVDPAGLAPGLYDGSVTFASNAANGAVTVPVEVEIIPQGPPVAYFGGAVNNATFARDDPIAQGGIVALFGEQFSRQDPASGTRIPLVQQLGGATVFVNDRPTPLYYSSYGQMNFQMPFEIPPGEALVRVEREGERGNTITVRVSDREPRILRLGIEDYGIVVNTDGSFPIPAPVAAQYGLPGHPAKAGDALVMYLIGMGQTQPPVATGAGAPADPLAWVQPQPRVVFGGTKDTDVFYAGMTPFFVGLYQVNVYVPQKPPKGDAVSVALAVDSTVISNKVHIAIQ